MTPLVRILVRSGVTFRDFAEVLKDVFVAVCARELETPDRPVTLSRLAITCGLTRKEVDQIVRDEARRRRELETYAKRLANLLEVWHSNSKYVGPYGFPRDLVIAGDDPAGGFERLVRESCDGVTPQRMLRELLRVGAARILEGGSVVRVVKRTYIPTEMTPEMVEIFTTAVRRYVETVDYNLTRGNAARKRFDRIVYPDGGLRESDVVPYETEMREYLETVISEIELKTSSYTRPSVERQERAVRVGIGLYFYEDIPPDTRPLLDFLDVSELPFFDEA